MLKTLKEKWPLMALIGISTLSVGLVVSLLKHTDAFRQPSSVTTEQTPRAVKESAVLGLVRQPAEQRTTALARIAQQAEGLERDRARYMLATDFINQGQASQALPLLEDLENTYTALPAYVLLRRGQAYMALDQTETATATWTELTRKYPDSPAAAEALYQLGQNGANPDTWNTLLQTLPSHPLSVSAALQRLAKTGQNTASTTSPQNPAAPNQANSSTVTAFDELSLLKIIAYHGVEHPNYVSALDRLVRQHSDALTPEDWAAVGFGYWEHQAYGRAGDAYAKAPATPRSLYRAARGKERNGKTPEAIALYTQLNQSFPDAPETPTGLLNLAQLQPSQAGLATLDQVISRFPKRAAEALVQRADRLEDLNSPDSAKQAKASILSQYSDSDAAAEIRLKQAKENAKAGNISAAIGWAQQLVDAAPKNELAAEAGFWLGKWAYRQNQPDLARQAFEQVIANHPEAYYAWRSAIYLDWEVGNFDTVRTLDPNVVLPQRRTPLPAGTPELQELYLLGHDQTAWNHWQSEFATRRSPSVSEQFTDGILRLAIGDNLDGIFMVSSLAWREDPAEIAEYESLKASSSFWQAIYPFQFPDLILGWAEERDLNPLLVTALVRQESRFQPNIRSVVGAVGLMQVMPETGEWISSQIGQDSYALDQPADNVKFGTWYLDFTHREYANNSLFAVASYNAGPNAVNQWVEEGKFTNADEFVENIPYPETKGYVEKVFGGYWNYLRTYDPAIAAKIAAL
ncbi:MAG: transglycosylase SLT domain-containing protein [Cyanobacteria bacterium J06623_4]